MTLDELGSMLRNAVYRGLRIRARCQRDHAGVANAKICGLVHSKLRVGHAAHFARQHRAGTRVVMSANDSILEASVLSLYQYPSGLRMIGKMTVRYEAVRVQRDPNVRNLLLGCFEVFQCPSLRRPNRPFTVWL